MPLVHTPPVARPGNPRPEHGKVVGPEEIKTLLRVREQFCFTKEEVNQFEQGPPKELLQKTSKSTLIFPLPGMSIEELVTLFSRPTLMPMIEAKHPYTGQSFFFERGKAQWARVDNPLSCHQPGYESVRMQNARELTIVLLALHILRIPPLAADMASSVSSSRCTDGFAIKVRMHNARLTYTKVDVHTPQRNGDAIGIRTANLLLD